MVTTTSREAPRPSARSLVALVVTTRTRELPASCAMLGARIALAWIFIYYGAGKLFGAFNGPGIHRTALYFLTPLTCIPEVSSPSWQAFSSSRAR